MATDAEPITEVHRPDRADLDLRTTSELVLLINDEDATVAGAVRDAAEALSSAIEDIVGRLEAGGRLVYVGAGTSGRLAVLDAAECAPTFGTHPDQVVALVAGGAEAVATAQEAAEDDEAAGVADVQGLPVGRLDAVVALSASGTTPYVLGAVRAAADTGALTVGVACVPDSVLAQLVDHPVDVVVGPEVIAGSTRMKAGTAQKLVLNTISTVSMVRLGKTYGNLMVDVVASNAKLRRRVRRVVALATGASDAEVEAALDAADGAAKVAIVSLLAGVEADEARGRLLRSGGVVRAALEER
jgi:N-acetylmuramic acid 6-phosphate etherase